MRSGLAAARPDLIIRFAATVLAMMPNRAAKGSGQCDGTENNVRQITKL